MFIRCCSSVQEPEPDEEVEDEGNERCEQLQDEMDRQGAPFSSSVVD